MTKMVFIRYPKHSTEHLIYSEHSNGGMTKLYSRNVEFHKDQFRSINEINDDQKQHELQQDVQLWRGFE